MSWLELTTLWLDDTCRSDLRHQGGQADPEDSAPEVRAAWMVLVPGGRGGAVQAASVNEALVVQGETGPRAQAVVGQENSTGEEA